MKKSFYSPREVAKILQCSRENVHKALPKGHFPNAQRVGACNRTYWIIPEEDVVFYLTHRRDYSKDRRSQKFIKSLKDKKKKEEESI